MANNDTKAIYWKRIGYVAIEKRGGGFSYYGGKDSALDFKFDGVFSGDVCPRFTVSVLGLTAETINDLTVWDPSEAFADKRRIRVYAGYEKDNMETPILDGFIIEAIPTNPPEMWMNFKCMMNISKGTVVEKPRVETDIAAEDVLDEIALGMELTSKWNANSVSGGQKLTSFEFSGHSLEMCKRLSDALRVTVRSDGIALYAEDKNPNFFSPKDSKSVNINTGLLSIGNVDLKGADITCRLNSKYPAFSWIDLKSKLMPKADGQYFIIKKRYVGHFRGQEWYVQLETLRYRKV